MAAVLESPASPIDQGSPASAIFVPTTGDEIETPSSPYDEDVSQIDDSRDTTSRSMRDISPPPPKRPRLDPLVRNNSSPKLKVKFNSPKNSSPKLKIKLNSPSKSAKAKRSAPLSLGSSSPSRKPPSVSASERHPFAIGKSSKRSPGKFNHLTAGRPPFVNTRHPPVKTKMPSKSDTKTASGLLARFQDRGISATAKVTTSDPSVDPITLSPLPRPPPVSRPAQGPAVDPITLSPLPRPPSQATSSQSAAVDPITLSPLPRPLNQVPVAQPAQPLSVDPITLSPLPRKPSEVSTSRPSSAAAESQGKQAVVPKLNKGNSTVTAQPSVTSRTSFTSSGSDPKASSISKVLDTSRPKVSGRSAPKAGAVSVPTGPKTTLDNRDKLAVNQPRTTEQQYERRPMSQNSVLQVKKNGAILDAKGQRISTVSHEIQRLAPAQKLDDHRASSVAPTSASEVSSLGPPPEDCINCRFRIGQSQTLRCDYCERLFHASCKRDSKLSDGKWECARCIKRQAKKAGFTKPVLKPSRSNSFTAPQAMPSSVIRSREGVPDDSVKRIADIYDSVARKKVERIQASMPHRSADEIDAALLHTRGDVEKAIESLIFGKARDKLGQLKVALNGTKEGETASSSKQSSTPGGSAQLERNESSSSKTVTPPRQSPVVSTVAGSSSAQTTDQTAKSQQDNFEPVAEETVQTIRRVVGPHFSVTEIQSALHNAQGDVGIAIGKLQRGNTRLVISGEWVDSPLHAARPNTLDKINGPKNDVLQPSLSGTPSRNPIVIPNSTSDSPMTEPGRKEPQIETPRPQSHKEMFEKLETIRKRLEASAPKSKLNLQTDRDVQNKTVGVTTAPVSGIVSRHNTPTPTTIQIDPSIGRQLLRESGVKPAGNAFANGLSRLDTSSSTKGQHVSDTPSPGTQTEASMDIEMSDVDDFTANDLETSTPLTKARVVEETPQEAEKTISGDLEASSMSVETPKAAVEGQGAGLWVPKPDVQTPSWLAERSGVEHAVVKDVGPTLDDSMHVDTPVPNQKVPTYPLSRAASNSDRGSAANETSQPMLPAKGGIVLGDEPHLGAKPVPPPSDLSADKSGASKPNISPLSTAPPAGIEPVTRPDLTPLNTNVTRTGPTGSKNNTPIATSPLDVKSATLRKIPPGWKLKKRTTLEQAASPTDKPQQKPTKPQGLFAWGRGFVQAGCDNPFEEGKHPSQKLNYCEDIYATFDKCPWELVSRVLRPKIFKLELLKALADTKTVLDRFDDVENCLKELELFITERRSKDSGADLAGAKLTTGDALAFTSRVSSRPTKRQLQQIIGHPRAVSDNVNSPASSSVEQGTDSHGDTPRHKTVRTPTTSNMIAPETPVYSREAEASAKKRSTAARKSVPITPVVSRLPMGTAAQSPDLVSSASAEQKAAEDMAFAQGATVESQLSTNGGNPFKKPSLPTADGAFMPVSTKSTKPPTSKYADTPLRRSFEFPSDRPGELPPSFWEMFDTKIEGKFQVMLQGDGDESSIPHELLSSVIQSLLENYGYRDVPVDEDDASLQALITKFRELSDIRDQIRDRHRSIPEKNKQLLVSHESWLRDAVYYAVEKIRAWQKQESAAGQVEQARSNPTAADPSAGTPAGVVTSAPKQASNEPVATGGVNAVEGALRMHSTMRTSAIPSPASKAKQVYVENIADEADNQVLQGASEHVETELQKSTPLETMEDALSVETTGPERIDSANVPVKQMLDQVSRHSSPADDVQMDDTANVSDGLFGSELADFDQTREPSVRPKATGEPRMKLRMSALENAAKSSEKESRRTSRSFANFTYRELILLALYEDPRRLYGTEAALPRLSAKEVGDFVLKKFPCYGNASDKVQQDLRSGIAAQCSAHAKSGTLQKEVIDHPETGKQTTVYYAYRDSPTFLASPLQDLSARYEQHTRDMTASDKMSPSLRKRPLEVQETPTPKRPRIESQSLESSTPQTIREPSTVTRSTSSTAARKTALPPRATTFEKQLDKTPQTPLSASRMKVSSQQVQKDRGDAGPRRLLSTGHNSSNTTQLVVSSSDVAPAVQAPERDEPHEYLRDPLDDLLEASKTPSAEEQELLDLLPAICEKEATSDPFKAEEKNFEVTDFFAHWPQYHPRNVLAFDAERKKQEIQNRPNRRQMLSVPYRLAKKAMKIYRPYAGLNEPPSGTHSVTASFGSNNALRTASSNKRNVKRNGRTDKSIIYAEDVEASIDATELGQQEAMGFGVKTASCWQEALGLPQRLELTANPGESLSLEMPEAERGKLRHWFKAVLPET